MEEGMSTLSAIVEEMKKDAVQCVVRVKRLWNSTRTWSQGRVARPRFVSSVHLLLVNLRLPRVLLSAGITYLQLCVCTTHFPRGGLIFHLP